MLRAYHWATFGEGNGVSIGPPPFSDGPFVLTALINRNIIHMVNLDPPGRVCRSITLDITRQKAESAPKLKGVQTAHQTRGGFYNAILDCYSEVWTHFPVESAIQRHTLVSGSRKKKSLVFVTDHDHGLFAPYFSAMIQAFKEQTKKPTGDRLTGDKLQRMKISSMSFDNFFGQVENMEISRFSAGEWLAELLCLIPIQIAVAQANTFVPLKDGVFSTEFERSQFGAEIGQIADNLSFGWYEPLFRTYYSQKVTGSLNVH